jgi:glycerol-3-phosphate acyltransferase PlsX
MNKMGNIRIALDAMGSDHAPQVEVEGAILASEMAPFEIVLVGDETRLRAELKKYKKVSSNLSIRHASEVIGMEDPPATSVRRKKDSSISVAVNLLKETKVDCLLSAGNTGAVVCAATINWGLIPGIERPGIAIIFPTLKGACLLIDAGANIDPKPLHLFQYGLMGVAYSRYVLGKDNPTVGLLNIGEEETKGTDFVKETRHLLMQGNMNFTGNIEGRDLFSGDSDVIVCDGFVGNVALKVSESLAHAFTEFLRRHIERRPLAKVGALFLKGAFRGLKKEIDYAEYGGAPLLGVNGICIICHGSSSPKAIKNAIRFAAESVRHNLTFHIQEELNRMGTH